MDPSPFLSEQLEMRLRQEFLMGSRPHISRITTIALELGLTVEVVQCWFRGARHMEMILLENPPIARGLGMAPANELLTLQAQADPPSIRVDITEPETKNTVKNIGTCYPSSMVAIFNETPEQDFTSDEIRISTKWLMNKIRCSICMSGMITKACHKCLVGICPTCISAIEEQAIANRGCPHCRSSTGYYDLAFPRLL